MNVGRCKGHSADEKNQNVLMSLLMFYSLLFHKSLPPPPQTYQKKPKYRLEFTRCKTGKRVHSYALCSFKHITFLT